MNSVDEDNSDDEAGKVDWITEEETKNAVSIMSVDMLDVK